MESAKAGRILLVEDNPDHAELTVRALKDGIPLCQVFWVKDGEEALDFLVHRGRYASVPPVPRPSLILLDINLPKIDGHAVLQRIKSDDGLRAIPVVMLSTSCRDDEVARTYQAGANSYVAKPARFADFIRCVRDLALYWAVTCLLPKP